MSSMLLHCGSKVLDLATPVVMGVLNITPDSFSDGGRYFDPRSAIAHAEQMVAEGAAIIDVGGESTRPGAAAVTVEEELRRVVPVVAAVVELGALVSVDTSKPEVMRASIDAGASLINDVRALQEPGALAAAAGSNAAACLMHMQGGPATMQRAPSYENVVTEVRNFLAQRVAACVEAGIPRKRLLLDPGIGFGKTLQHNLALLAHLEVLRELELPLLIGVSRKSLIGALTGRPAEQRLHGGIALTAAAVLAGASIIRAHDVAATVDAARVAAALRDAGFVTGPRLC